MCGGSELRSTGFETESRYCSTNLDTEVPLFAAYCFARSTTSSFTLNVSFAITRIVTNFNTYDLGDVML